jgi:hypothetical protein
VALERLNARLPSLRLQHNQELRYKPNLTLRGLERLLVEWNATSTNHCDPAGDCKGRSFELLQQCGQALLPFLRSFYFQK